MFAQSNITVSDGTYNECQQVFSSCSEEDRRLVCPVDELSTGGNLHIVAYDNDNPVGFVLGTPWFLDNSSETLLICITKKYRGKGVGTKLINFFKSRLKELGFKSIIWRVRKDNMSSIRLAEKNGGVEQITTDDPPSHTRYEIKI